MNSSIFIKGDVTLELESGRTLHFTQKNISTFGVMGLSWSNLSPEIYFGQSILTELRFRFAYSQVIRTPTSILRERSIHSSQMGLRFHMDPEQSKILTQLIKKHGRYPTEYIRKYPRIPSTEMIQTIPLRASVMIEGTNESTSEPILINSSRPWIIHDVENLSLNGILLSSESSLTQTIQPGDRVQLILDPRGWFPLQVHIHGMVCRIVDEQNRESKNTRRRLGIKFTRFTEVDKQAFMDLLKEVLSEIKAAVQGSQKD